MILSAVAALAVPIFTGAVQDPDALIEFGRFLQKVKADAAPTVPTVMMDKLLASRGSGLAQAAYSTVKMLCSGEWSATAIEASALQEYATKFLAQPQRINHKEAFELLARRVQDVRLKSSGNDASAARILALAHLAAIPYGDRDARSVALRFESDLRIKDTGRGWVCKEGEAISDARSLMGSLSGLKEAASKWSEVKDPAWNLFLAIAAAKAGLTSGGQIAEAIPDVLDFITRASYPSSDVKSMLAKVKSVLSKAKPCKWCGGTNQVPCDLTACNDGKVTKRCGACNGDNMHPQGRGRISPESGRPATCPATTPVPGKHIWEETCYNCKGTSAIKCRSCREPWTAPSLDMLVQNPCELCGSSGLLLGGLEHPCTVCYGIGEKVELGKSK